MIPSLQIGQMGRSVPASLGIVDETEVRRGLRSKIVNYWEFNNTLADTGRAGVTWAGAGTYTTGPGGAANDALAATAATQTVSTTKGVNAYHTSQAFSYGGFFRASGSSGGFRYTGSVTPFRLDKDNALGWGTSMRVTGVQETVYSGNFSTAWIFVVITVNNGVVRIYLDGSLTTTGSVNLGSMSTTAANRWDLVRDNTDVSRLFYAHDELSESEIAYLYNNGNGRAASEFMSVAYGTTPDTYALTLGLSGYWKFNESAGTSAADSAGGLGAATLTNGSAFINTLDPPPGFDPADYVCDNDGTNDYARLPNLDYSSGSLSDTFFGWFYTDAMAAGERYWRAGTDTSNANNERVLNVAGTTSNVSVEVYSAAGASLGGATGGGAAVTGAWRLHAHYYDDTNKVLLSISEGIVNGGAICSASPSAVLLDEVSIMSRVGNAANVSVDGKLSRSGIKKGGVVTLPQLAKFYDLSNNSG